MIGQGVAFNLIGLITLSEIFLFIYFLVIIFNKKLFETFKNYPVLKKITWLYLGLLTVQILSEIVISNTFNSALKGIAITVVSYLYFIFLFMFFIKDRQCIIYAFIGTLLCLLIFGSKLGMEGQGTVQEALSGENAKYLKFYLVQFITIPLFIISAFTTKKRRIAIAIVFVGLMLVVLGARSSGGTFALSGMISYFILIRNTINQKKIITTLLVVAVAGYGLYVVYVNQVLEGKIIAGNSEQILLLKNPYNPINLLFAGRTEAVVGWQAFMDKPLFGHGSWAVDKTGKYIFLLAKLKKLSNGDAHDDFGIIPSHSVLIGSGVNNGIFAFLFIFAILFFFIKTGFKAINKKDPYISIVIFYIFSLLWVGLFSATPAFKNTMPLAFAFLLASHIINNSKKQEKIINEKHAT